MSSYVTTMNSIAFPPELFETFKTGTVLDELLCSYQGLPKGVNYMVIGDPGVGKTTVVLDCLANILKNNPRVKVLFISAEMTEIDLAIYAFRYPKIGNLKILFIESNFEKKTSEWENLNAELAEGYDIVAIDSFFELQGIVKEEENVNMKTAESMLLSLIKKHNKGENGAGKNTTFLTIQQVTKSGAFLGSNRLKHAITAMMELRLASKNNPYSDRFVVFSKHRRGDVGKQLYYSLEKSGDVTFDESRYRTDMLQRDLAKKANDAIIDYAEKFKQLFQRR